MTNRNCIAILLWMIWSLANAASPPSPSIKTEGDCSGVATNGGVINAHCKKIYVLNKNAPVLGRVLFVTEAWLSPALGFEAWRGESKERAELTTVVRNLSNEVLLITAVKLDIIGHTTLKKAGWMTGEHILQTRAAGTEPIAVLPGGSSEISFAETLGLEGITAEIEHNDNLDDALILDDIKPPRINGTQYVERFSRIMEARYGKDTRLRVTYFVGDYRPIAQVSIPIANGTDFFYHGEATDKKTGKVSYQPRLAYDAFLGQYLKQKEIWVPGFHIRETPTHCIDVIPDASTPGGLDYQNADCKARAPIRRF